MNNENLKQKIIHDAAQLLGQLGLDSIQYAKTKAAKKWQVIDTRKLPSNEEILLEFKRQQSLFDQTDTSAEELKYNWQQIYYLMEHLQEFRPRLADYFDSSDKSRPLVPNAAFELFLRPNTVEDVSIALMGLGIDYNLKEKKVLCSKNKLQVLPFFDLYKASFETHLVIVTAQDQSIRPINSISNKPLSYLNMQAVNEILENLAS